MPKARAVAEILPSCSPSTRWICSHSARASEGAEAQKLQGIGAPRGAALALVETGDDTLFVTQLRESLPGLKDRTDAATKTAKDEKARLHLREMSVQVARLIKVGTP